MGVSAIASLEFFPSGLVHAWGQSTGGLEVGDHEHNNNIVSPAPSSGPRKDGMRSRKRRGTVRI